MNREGLREIIFNIANEEGDANIRLAGMFYDVCEKYNIRVMGGHGRDYFMAAVGGGLVNLCIANDNGVGAFGRSSISKDSVFGGGGHSMSNFRHIDEKEVSLHLNYEEPTKTPEEKEALDTIEQVEWNGEGLPPVGVECEMIFDGKVKLITPLYLTDFVDGLVLFYHSSNSKTHCDDTYGWCLVGNCIFRKPETPEAKKDREEINNIAAHLWGRKLSLEVNELARLLHGLGYRKPDTERESD